jgi:ribosomal protein L7Ae-like RNA K-turn-binding protein
MTDSDTTKPVERLFPFVLKTRGLVIGREALGANKGKLHFVLIATDISDASREEVLKDFIHYPVVQHFTAAELQAFFHFKDAKAVGFLKSGLAQSIYAELKAHRINRPFVHRKPEPSDSNGGARKP